MCDSTFTLEGAAFKFSQPKKVIRSLIGKRLVTPSLTFRVVLKHPDLETRLSSLHLFSPIRSCIIDNKAAIFQPVEMIHPLKMDMTLQDMDFCKKVVTYLNVINIYSLYDLVAFIKTKGIEGFLTEYDIEEEILNEIIDQMLEKRF